MRIICTLLFSVFALTVHGQAAKKAKPQAAAPAPAPAPKPADPCSLIKKDISEDKTTFDFQSPFDAHEPHPVRITRNYSTNPEYSFDNFFVVLELLGDIDNTYMTNSKGEHVEKDESKVVIEFADKSKIVDDTMKINHDVSEDKSQSVRYVYFPVTETNYKDFATKQIVKISLAGYEQAVPVDSTNSFQKYLECIKAVKK